MLSLVLFLALTTTEVTVVSLPARGGLNLAVAPSGRLDLERAGTISRVRIEIDRIQPASTQGSGLNTYVIWTVSPEGAVENIGALDVEGGKGRLEATTKFQQFGVFVTAEPHYLVDRPNSTVLFRNREPQAANVRRIVVPVTVGVHDYSRLESSPAGTPDLVGQSRSAFQIAQLSEAERLAESEFRQARVALDTMEELLMRRALPDLLESAAREAVRRSHLAAVTARERVLPGLLDNARSEAAALTRERDQLQARVQQLTQQLADQQAAAESESQKLQAELAEVRRQHQQLAFEAEQTAARLSNAEGDVAELIRKQEELQNRLTFELRPTAFNARKALTADGRDALNRIIGVAGYMLTGAIRIEGPFDTATEKVVTDFLVAAGVSPDRIILVRK